MVGQATLPGGFWHEGRSFREVELRPLTGADEAYLSDETRGLLPAERTSVLLERCIDRLGPLSEVSLDSIRSLTVGDREALLLQLRRLTFGEHLECQLSCPNSDCGEKLEVSLEASELLVAPYREWEASYQTTVEEKGISYGVRFRLPTGGDQERVARLAQEDPEAAEQELLTLCIEEVWAADDGSHPVAPAEWPAAVGAMLPEVLEKLDPQAELTIRMTCPACHERFVALLDAGEVVYRELTSLSQQVFREVHLLALHYHWSEAEILAMTPRRRAVYLNLLADSLGREVLE